MKSTLLFKAFLAVGPKKIRSRVVISPILYPKHFSQKAAVKKSRLGYLVADYRKFILIKTPLTQQAVGDVVILLKETKCREIIFVGAAGGLEKRLRIGEIIYTKNPKLIHSVSSLHEETRRNLLAWRKKGLLAIDFEAGTFFKAAKKAGLAASAYFIITDRPLTKPFYLAKSQGERAAIQQALATIVRQL
jgi:uridine phosphorylase